MGHLRLAFPFFASAFLASALVAGCSSEVVDDIEVGDTDAELSSSQMVAELRRHLAAHDVTPVDAAPTVRRELVELGRLLAFDKVLSGNKDIACLTCHHPEIGSDDDRSLSIGTGGTGLGSKRKHPQHVRIPRSAPALFVMHEMPSMFWDSRVEMTPRGLKTPAGSQLTPAMRAVFEFGVVSAQAMFPVTSPDEMRGHPGENDLADIPGSDLQGIWSALMRRLGQIPEYVRRFEGAYPGTTFSNMTFAHAANAIAGFEVSAFDKRNSPFQRFLKGDDQALKTKELQGGLRFFEAGCANCHSGSMLSNFDHHNTCLAQFGPGKGDGAGGNDDLGRFRETGSRADAYAFRTPTLHNAAVTGPYGHDGQYKTLRDHIEHYADARSELRSYNIKKEVSDKVLHTTQVNNQEVVINTLDPAMDGLVLTKNDAKQIAEFVISMTDRSARNMRSLVPSKVPSGLPIKD